MNGVLFWARSLNKKTRHKGGFSEGQLRLGIDKFQVQTEDDTLSTEAR